MLILLIFVHILSSNGSVAPVALPLAPQTSTDTCDDLNSCRKLFDIVWGCLATIFACTWVSVHPNVPPPDQSRPALFRRRLRMMLIGIIAPEIMVGFAARQFFGAWKLSRNPKYKFSMTHGYFFCMGGFVSSEGYPITTKEQLNDSDLGPEFLKGIQNVKAEDIQDKSKGDALSKAVALAQGLWFTTKCLARMNQQLVVTELEVVTLAFAMVNIFVWLLWWHKPLDVQRPIVVGPPKSLDAQPINPRRLSGFNLFFYTIDGVAEDIDYDPLSSTSVPSFWSPPMSKSFRYGTMGMTAFAGAVFGAIHCAAWNTDFPTAAEMWIWRAGSLVIAAMPVGSLLAFVLHEITWGSPFGVKNPGTTNFLFCLIPGSILIYMSARLILIPVPFAALRSLPPLAFVDVDWSAYIPHI
ncbi:hypothetical protein B0H14DRAFT_2541828 [Mycena olivaceomarginata]|nr:hypothetical protein B0H14DRAFT_2541828 [Mycena olivaceomarginata]